MKKIFHISLTLLLSAGVISCAQNKQAASGNTISSGVSGSEAGKDASIGYKSVSMTRTGCFGRCPSYEVTVNEDGLVHYHGKGYTKYEGHYEKQISAKDAANLLGQFEAKKADTCQSKYEVHVADIPGINYKITMADGTEKSITHAHFGPMYLKELAREVDKVSQVDETWKKVGDNPTPPPQKALPTR